MSVIICSRPECRTTAGCICHTKMLWPPDDRDTQIDRLHTQLARAREIIEKQREALEAARVRLRAYNDACSQIVEAALAAERKACQSSVADAKLIEVAENYVRAAGDNPVYKGAGYIRELIIALKDTIARAESYRNTANTMAERVAKAEAERDKWRELAREAMSSVAKDFAATWAPNPAVSCEWLAKMKELEGGKS